MSSFEQIKESLDRVLNCAREIADKASLAFNSADSFRNDVRNLRRDLPHLIGRAMRTFQGGELLSADLQHELNCVQEDAFQVADWIKRAAEQGDELQKSSSVGAVSTQLWGEMNHKAFLESIQQREMLKATCDRARLRATEICTATDKAAEKPDAPLTEPERRLKTAKGEAASTTANEPDSASDSELHDREKEILQALLLLGSTSKRTRVPRQRAAAKADPSVRISTFGRFIAALRGRGLVASQTGQQGGIWLTPKGLAAAKQL